MPVRTLDVALWDYRDEHGRKHRAYYGHQIELTDSEIERGNRAAVFAAQDRIADTGNVADERGPEVKPPPRVSTNATLVDWLVEHRGAEREDIANLTKAQLWQRIDAPESDAAQHDSTNVAT
jgi:hypothetical protein